MMPTVLTFPAEVAILIQERNNGGCLKSLHCFGATWELFSYQNQTFKKLKANLIKNNKLLSGWYSCWTYYWTKIIADTPYQLMVRYYSMEKTIPNENYKRLPTNAALPTGYDYLLLDCLSGHWTALGLMAIRAV